MVKEKRKARLDKGEGGEFIGFGAFANTTTTAVSGITVGNNPSITPAITTASSTPTSSTTSLSPIYTGSDASLNIIFSRIGQKRDATTKAKALAELATYFQEETHPKKAQAEALSHFLYLYQSKLSYDNTPRIRSSSIQVCQYGRERLPKAWNTLLCSNNNKNNRNVEIVGMLLCARADPASEVRTAATSFSKVLLNGEETKTSEGLTVNNEDPACLQCCQEGIWSYVQRILSFQKPIAMHQDLFQKGSSSLSSSSSTPSLSEQQKEELEERFERIVGTAIEGLNVHLQEPTVVSYMNNIKDNNNNNDNEPTNYTTSESTKFLWKTLSSNKVSLRRKTYALLSTVCQKMPWTIDVDKTSKLLTHSLSSEKESTNTSQLLETLLAFIASLPKTERSAAMVQYTKPLTKLFKKGCYGASASAWTPMVLPIVALLPSGLDSVGNDGLPAQADVLTCVWEGRSQVVGVADGLQVAQAVAETATFLLQNQLRTPEPAFHQVIAKCWLNALQSYLTTSESLTGPALQSHTNLGTVLSQSLVQFQQACTNKPQSAIAGLSNYFWNQELPVVVLQNDVSNVHLTKLLSDFRIHLSGVSSDEASTRQLIAPVLRQKFHAILAPARTKSNWVPNIDSYNLWIIILQVVSADEIFTTGDQSTISLDSFVMNHILTWFVRHTSTLSAELSKSLAILDTRLLVLALSASNETKVAQWAAILRECLLADPSLSALTACLACLLQQGWKSADVVASSTDVFSQFCIRIAETAVDRASESALHHKHNMDDSDSMSESSTVEVDDEASHSTLQFLLFCVGLAADSNTEALVDDDVMEAWCNATCPEEISRSSRSIERNPVLDTLITVVQADKLQGKEEMSIRILMQSWRLGGRVWDEKVLPLVLLPANMSLCSKLVEKSSQQSSSEAQLFARESSFDEENAWQWTSRAYRLLQLCPDEASERLPSFSLSAVGMGSIELWKQNPSPSLSACILSLVKHVDSAKRWELFANVETSPLDLFIWILIHLSGGGLTEWEADRARRRTDMTSKLLSYIDLVHDKVDVLDSSILKCVAIVKGQMDESQPNEKLLARSIAVLSMLVGSRFAPIRPLSKKSISISMPNTSDFNVGDTVWYISNPSDFSTREECKILKMHNDLPGEVYFTIQLNRDDDLQERQTLSERLRKTESDQDEHVLEPQDIYVSIDNIGKSEKLEREKFAKIIVDALILPYNGTMKSLCFELYNVLICQCGLVGGRGIGSLHYSVLQQLLRIQNTLQISLAEADQLGQSAVDSLLCLGLALGSGLNVPSSQFAIVLLGLDVTASLQVLLKVYDDETNESSTEIDVAVARFLGISMPTVTDQTVLNHGFSILFQVAARLFSTTEGVFGEADYLALKSMEIGQRESQKYGEGQSILQDSEGEAISALITAFSDRWNGAQSLNEPSLDVAGTRSWSSLPVFEIVMKGMLKHRPRLVAHACRQSLDNMVSCLYCTVKRWDAMKVLTVYADHCRPIFNNDSDDEIINPLTLGLLDKWTEGLLEEEAEDLEDDVGVVAEWVCAKQMNDIESWQDDDKIDDDVAFGRMLSWLFFLQVVDAATAKDSMHRPSFLAYISCCGAVNAILDLAMVYGNVSSGRKYKFEKAVPLSQLLDTEVSDSTLEMSKLASLIMFRTVEVFPTLSKTWWEMHCPSKLTGTVQEFVESQVSPQVLKTALESIQHATAFGQMQVKGSSTTGEITATYVQDDLTLSVIIQVPSSFPFRRAEVDCSKTFGVPAARSRRWALMITQMINNQGGTLKDALLLWKENVDKEFEGVEPCPVCYSVLHVKSHRLPNLECNTCHNHFHDECLKEWFHSSNKNSCVICQQPWQGTKI
ncbi:hypothetical protein IV203_012413 [Nitzschia inconspicua]|uniref:E3 ubiquitin-protein ligase listerin n=1 Tax=Nitzschia inconspicua TaxID=303405 RepID=A0A9K3KUV5_9STRA|nr:hypothetical protein IV203_012413 [Nitzschia inconspicua]